MATLKINELNKNFGSTEVLKGINLEIKRGELVALMGPSGCGKSTLLNIIGGLLPGDEGEIELEDVNNAEATKFTYGTDTPNKVVNVRRNGVGWIFQDFHLVEHLTAIDNVAMALEIAGMEQDEAEEKAKSALTKVGLGDRIDFGAEQLSGGQRQRVAVARAIAGSRPLLLADEPTGNLDAVTGEKVLHYLFQLIESRGHSLVLVTHAQQVAKLCTKNYVLEAGILKEVDG